LSFVSQPGDYLPILVGASSSQSSTVETNSALTPATEPATEQTSSEVIPHEPQSSPTPTLRERIAERLRAANRAALSTATTDSRTPPSQPDPLGLTAAIERLDFSAPTIAPALDELGDEGGWDLETSPQQPSARADNPQPDRLNPTPRPGREPSLADEPERTIQPTPTSPEPAAGEHDREPSIAERLTDFAEQLQRETEAHRNRASQAERSNRRSNRQYGYSIGADQPGEQKPVQPGTRTESAAAEVAQPHVIPAEPGLGGQDIHLPRLDSVDRAGSDLRDRLRLDAEPVFAGDADPHQWAGEQYREAAGADREVGEAVADGVEAEAIVEPDYRQLWHEYHQRLQPRGYPVEQDQAIARCVLAEQGVEVAYKVIAQSPRLESPMMGYTPTTYVQWVVSGEQHRLLPEEEQHRSKYAVRVVRDWVGLGDESYEREGSRFVIQYDGQTKTLTVDAKDGRGEVLRAVMEHPIASALTEADRQVFEGVDRVVEAQRQQEREAKRQKSRGLELD
jgi:hypothetical protein